MHAKAQNVNNEIQTQTMSSSNPRASVNLMPDSAVFISRLESKLRRISSKNPTKVTGKDLIKNMAEFKDMYMTEYLRNANITGSSEHELVIYNQTLKPVNAYLFIYIYISSDFICISFSLKKKFIFIFRTNKQMPLQRRPSQTLRSLSL